MLEGSGLSFVFELVRHLFLIQYSDPIAPLRIFAPPAVIFAAQHATQLFTPPCAQFTHATRFLGKKVILLGLYNGQKLEAVPPADVITYSRVLAPASDDSSFVRVLLARGRVRGAVMIGETDLEEAFENLILDGLDVGGYGPALLDPDIELDHVFD